MGESVKNFFGGPTRAVGQAALKSDEQQRFDALQQRRSQMLDTYGHSEYVRDWIDDGEWKPQAELVNAGYYGDYANDPEVKRSIQSINTTRARWNDASDAERQIATDSEKQLRLDFDKRNRDRNALEQASLIMDMRQKQSQAAGNSGGRRPIYSGGPSAFESSTPGVKTKLGE